ncbi:MAG: c-type cytochrome biogenesis protein CcsB [Syntrophaceae bacterium]|nr:c-type cytochrome biogenesis protein CcsB [Syntrophaceae bacterium]
MINPTLFQFTMFIYLLSTLLYGLYLVTRNEGIGKSGTVAASLGFILNGVAMGYRWYETHQLGIAYLPLSNMYESMVFFSWTIVGIYLFFERVYRTKGLGAFILPLGFLTVSIAVLGLNPDVRPLMPALQSDWLFYHVVTCFLGYAAFAVSFGVSLVYLFRKEDKTSNSILPSQKILEEMNYRSIVVGFLLFAVGIITGAIWANYAWGTYWSWDPKETWSLITWLVYAILLHMRYTGRLVGRRMAFVSIVGFVSVVFTYWGVNYLLSGLHSYA